MKIIFAGTPKVAATVLETLLDSGINIVGVISREDAPIGRKQVITESPVSALALGRGLPLFRTNNFSDEVRSWISSLGADLGFIVAYGSILRRIDLEALPFGWLNLHFSLLPEYPGPAPVQHAILNGALKTGVTLFRLDEGIDSGPIVSQKEVEISDSDNAESLLEKLSSVGCQLVIDALEYAPNSLEQAMAQPKGASSAVAFKPSRAMGKLDFTESASKAHNQIRALNPEPGAFAIFEGQVLRVLSSRQSNQLLPSGECRMIDKEAVVGFNQGSLVLLLVQPAGSKVMSGADWLRGRQGDRAVILS